MKTKVGDIIKFRLDRHPANESEGKLVKKFGKQIVLSITKPVKDFKVGENIVIWEEEIIK